MPMTIRQMLASTPKSVKENALGVKIVKAEIKVKKKSGNPILRTVTYSLPKPGEVGKKPRYDTTVEGLMGNGSNIGDRYVKVSCSCGFFTYWGCEYSLWKRGAADIIYSNGEPPVVRNPKQIPMVCKHLVRVLDAIMKKGL